MKPIKLTESIKEKALQNFQTLLDGYDGTTDLSVKITAETLLETVITKPIVYITADAYLKISNLVNASNKELAWHGIVEKVENNYLIKDILVYPQTVTSSTVDADEEAYAMWLMKLPDETINNLRFQGHSHVSMPASPSGRDTDNWQKFLNLLKEDEFYVFCIANKAGTFYWCIYDNAKNVMFENADITMKVIDNKAVCIKEWTTENIEQFITDNTPPMLSTVANNVSCLQNSFASDKPLHITNKSRSETKTITRDKSSTKDIPENLINKGVAFQEDLGIYYSDTYVEGFRYSTLWGCFVMDEEDFQARYAKYAKKPGRPLGSGKKNNKQVKGE